MDWDIVAIVAAGLSVFLAVLAVLWPRKVRVTITGAMLPDTAESAKRAADTITALQSSLHKRGKHLRTD